ncbi:hypothetical protein APX70_200543 [Pseudomonas syringae pv. maculicola]|uniref:Uncharacterized protein n=1 Tax=Pseudomonas syringae pv. maculicola TaxID=59511 RepID=A0A3M3A205_PSEYM|nr:hypothetical protein APX70_200543 [Pseudomonas syringae pv. maculicola]
MVVRCYTEQLQLHVRVFAEGFFQREVLPANAADGITGSRAVVESYTHERDPCLGCEKRV